MNTSSEESLLAQDAEVDWSTSDIPVLGWIYNSDHDQNHVSPTRPRHSWTCPNLLRGVRADSIYEHRLHPRAGDVRFHRSRSVLDIQYP
ncbi:hypothetical protein VTL71DRAFT_3017 [Oculimacula yallundae]|uniref:Uncharacterized protein n=1 Tax=Oculimacula yallundae TaxID=86028 RepID=A0ABR4C872_9HELO